MKYLVTGAAGFIASKVCEQLLEAGHTVVGLDNLNDYYDVRLKDYRLSRLLAGAGEAQSGKRQALGDDPKRSVYVQPLAATGVLPLPLTASRFAFYHLDIENLPALDALFAAHKFDAVFNLAARAGVRASIENPAIYRSTNILGEENVLKCQVKYGVKKHVLASSSSVYAGCPMPFTEDAVLGQGQSPYAETKKQAEILAREYHDQHGLDVTVLRYFTVFGPAGRPDMAPFRFIKWIDEGTPITLYGDGTQARDFTYVDDIARGTVLAGQLRGGLMSDVGRQMSDVSGQMSDVGRQTPDVRCQTSAVRCRTSDVRCRTSDVRRQRSDVGRRTSDVGRQRSDVSGQMSDVGRQTSDVRCRTSDVGRQSSDFAPSYDVINLGGGNNPLTIAAMIGIIEEALSAQSAKRKAASASDASRLPPGSLPVKAVINGLPASAADMKATWADITKARRLLGWAPQIAPEDGFKRAVEWHIANRVWLERIKL